MKKFIRIWKNGECYKLKKYKISNVPPYYVTLQKEINQGGYYPVGYIVKQRKLRYWRVNLTINGVQSIYKIHRLLYGTFIGPIGADEDVHHKDTNKINNKPNNLITKNHGEHSRKTNKGRIHKGQALKNMKEASRRKIGTYHHTKEWKEEASKRMSGKNHRMYGKAHTEESKEKMSITRMRRYKNG